MICKIWCVFDNSYFATTLFWRCFHVEQHVLSVATVCRWFLPDITQKMQKNLAIAAVWELSIVKQLILCVYLCAKKVHFVEQAELHVAAVCMLCFFMNKKKIDLDFPLSECGAICWMASSILPVTVVCASSWRKSKIQEKNFAMTTVWRMCYLQRNLYLILEQFIDCFFLKKCKTITCQKNIALAAVYVRFLIY